MQCVDFRFDGVEGPRLNMDLASGETVTRLVDVQKPPNEPTDSVMSIHELSKLDDVEFQLRESDDLPGVLLKKDGIVTWTPVA